MNMRIKTRIGMAALLATVFVSSTAFADQITDIKKKGELVCGTLGVSRGFSFVSQSNRQLIGYEVDLCDKLAQSLNVKPVMKSLAVAARIPELQQGRVDVLLAELTVTPERAEVVDFSTPYFVAGAKIMVKKDGGISNFNDLGGKKIVTTKGSTMEQNLRKELPTADVISFDTTTQAFLAFVQGKGAGYCTDEISLLTSRAALGESGKDMVILPRNISIESLAAGVRKGEPAMLSQVNEVFAGLEKSGDADKLFMKWFGPETDIHYDHRDFRIDGKRT
jgi:polar amino acid transport system substrate-binding protein